MERAVDAVVVGAGLSGSLTALALADAGFEVCLVDRAAGAASGDDPRTTALAYASVRALRRLGVWDRLEAEAAPVRDIAVATGRRGGPLRPPARGARLQFSDLLLGDTERWEGTPLAVIVPNAALAEALLAACDQSERITRRTGTVIGTKPGQGGVTVRLDDGELGAALVVACDGRRSALRRRAGLRVIERDFGQDALTLTVSHGRPHEGTARQVFLPGGPLAALPLPGNRSSLVWSMPRGVAAAFAAEPTRLAEAAAEHLPELGPLTDASAPARFPLGLVYAPSVVADRLALVGEAGRAIHPLAGQGYNLAAQDACALADVLAEARGVGLDIGHGAVLARYDQWRRLDASLMAFGTSGLAQVLGTRERVTRGLAGVGFGLVERSDALKRRLVRRAGGAAGRTPSLMAADA